MLQEVGRRGALIITCTLLVAGCGQSPAGDPPPTPSPPRTGDPVDLPTIVFLGDSLTSGFGVDEDQAFPALVGDALVADGTPVRVVNAGVNGDTTAGGLARLDWLLRQEPDVLVVGLGGNDGLRGQDPDASERNLREILERSEAAGVTVVLLGMQLPPNYGAPYLERFAAIFPRLAEAYDVVLVPFMLEGVGGEPHLNLPDGIHPNPEGHAVVANTLLPYVREALDRARDTEQ